MKKDGRRERYGRGVVREGEIEISEERRGERERK